MNAKLRHLWSTKKILLYIFVLALIVRVAWGVYHFRTLGTRNFIDDWLYISYAKNIVDQGIFVPDIERMYSSSHHVGPGYPLVVALVFLMFGERYEAVIVLNAIISALGCVLLYYIGKELFSRTVGLLSAFWGIAYVLFIYQVPTVIKDVWLAFLFPLFIYAFILETKRAKASVISLLPVILFVYLIHTDERFFIFLPLLLVSFLFLDSIDLRNGLRKAVLFFSLVIVLMIPWLVRNYIVYDRPVILTVRTTKFTDKLFGVSPEKAYRIRNKIDYKQFMKNKAFSDSVLAAQELPDIVGSTDQRMQAEAAAEPVPYKYSTLERWWVEFKEFWRPFRFTPEYVDIGFRYERPWSLKHNLSVGITYGLLLPFFLTGIVLIARRRDRKDIFIISIIVLYTILHVVLLWSRNRYRIPIDTFVIAIAFYGMTRLYDIVIKRFKRIPA